MRIKTAMTHKLGDQWICHIFISVFFKHVLNMALPWQQNGVICRLTGVLWHKCQRVNVMPESANGEARIYSSEDFSYSLEATDR